MGMLEEILQQFNTETETILQTKADKTAVEEVDKRLKKKIPANML